MVSNKTNDEKANSTSAATPLLADTKEGMIDKQALIPYREAFQNIWKISSWQILSALFHPVYSIVNAIVLGH
jgi:hypothetical protein